MDGTSDLRADANIDSAKEVSTKEGKNCYAVEKTIRHESRHTGTEYIVFWHGYRHQCDTVELAEHIYHHIR